MRLAGYTSVLAVVTVSLVLASSAGATHAAAVCKSFKSGGLTYSSETLGTSWSCGAAKTWIVKLSADKVGKVTKNKPLKNGPSGLHCFATPNSIRGRATAGACIKGTIAYPGTGFAWFSN